MKKSIYNNVKLEHIKKYTNDVKLAFCTDFFKNLQFKQNLLFFYTLSWT